MMKRLLTLVITIGLAVPMLAQQLPAFPGADGYGRYTSGGRGGAVLHVTNLNDDGEGSLRWAIAQSGPRTIVFDVSGIIELESTLSINNGDITIAGQTAPGDGICIKGDAVSINADNVIIRYIRCRMGDEQGTEHDAMGGTHCSNVIIDHCSLSWSTDECASFYGNRCFTMQWCIISESLNASVHGKGRHGYGGIWGGEGATFHHNLMAHHKSRMPRLCGSRYTGRPGDERVDLRNNVFYNWADNSGYAGEGGSYNFVNNYYKPGPATARRSHIVHRIFAPYADNGNHSNKKGVWGQFYVAGNYFDNTCQEIQRNSAAMTNIGLTNRDNKEGIHPNGKVPSTVSLHADTEFKMAPVCQHTATVAYEKVLRHAGASLKRDTIDRRIAREVLEGSTTHQGARSMTPGIIDSQTETEGYPTYTQGPRLRDSDSDGIPDAWERANGLNPTMAADASECFPGAGGYTALEVYINSIVEDITKECLANTGHETEEYFPFFILPEYSCDDYYKNR